MMKLFYRLTGIRILIELLPNQNIYNNLWVLHNVNVHGNIVTVLKKTLFMLFMKTGDHILIIVIV